MALINFSGIASGIDSGALIQALLDKERTARVAPLSDKITSLQDTSSVFGELKVLLNSLKEKTSAFRLVNGGALEKLATSSDETIVSANASNAATNGSYQLSVTQIAKNATFSFKSNSTYTSSSDKISATMLGSDDVSVLVGSGSDQESVEISVDSSTTLSDFVTEFNAQSSKATASLINVGTSANPDYRIVINSNNQGLQKGELQISVGAGLTTAGAFNDNSLSQAQNAELSLSGIGSGGGDIIERDSNSISDLIPGVTLELASVGSATISIADDASATSASLQSFVDAYNQVVKYIAENDIIERQEDGDQVENIFGPLAGTSLDENILSALRKSLIGSGQTGSSVNILADLGITTARDGSLEFDSALFEEALSKDPEAVRTITQNLGESLASTDGTIAQFTRFNGIIDLAIRSNDSQVRLNQERIADAERALARQEEVLTAQFARLEALIGKLNNQQSSLASILPAQ
ncbi:MAG: flagellar filament capping protein FliD [Bdellovibrionales bacterium]|nr:flagellar filament capping protein FliD [Bdellovibrionales bacterium]